MIRAACGRDPVVVLALDPEVSLAPGALAALVGQEPRFRNQDGDDLGRAVVLAAEATTAGVELELRLPPAAAALLGAPVSGLSLAGGGPPEIGPV